MTTPSPGSTHLTSGGIVGRREELEALRQWLEAAREGAGRLVLCGGEPGIGKTRLAQELAGVALAGGMPSGGDGARRRKGRPRSGPGARCSAR